MLVHVKILLPLQLPTCFCVWPLFSAEAEDRSGSSAGSGGPEDAFLDIHTMLTRQLHSEQLEKVRIRGL